MGIVSASIMYVGARQIDAGHISLGQFVMFSTFLSGDPTGIAVIEAAVRDALANPEADTTDFAWSWGTLGTYGNMAKWTERFTEATRAYEIGMQAAERMRLPVAIAAVAVMHGDTCIRIGKLQEALQREYPDVTIEVINAGVPGYTESPIRLPR